ncbi:hypothetical protein AGMMS49975_17800 [Clostridia bacterium]|nr:hypothetical protein AGMMS49975_17800 [Clostridia bacterium]
MDVVNENNANLKIKLQTEKGEIECGVVAVFKMQLQDYIALLPLNSGEQEQQILLYRYSELSDENGNEAGIEIFTIYNDDEFNDATDIFQKMMEDSGMVVTV